ncbi:MAG: sulfotransferase [Pseudomonadota bacterium]
MIFPAAAIVHCVRNPIDTCLSAYFTNFQTGFSYSFDLHDLGSYYRAYADLMNHWRSIMPGDLFTIRYEDLVGDRDHALSGLKEALGLTLQKASVNDAPAARDIRTSSVWQARQPIYTYAVARWKNYEKHIGPLIDALGDLAE